MPCGTILKLARLRSVTVAWMTERKRANFSNDVDYLTHFDYTKSVKRRFCKTTHAKGFITQNYSSPPDRSLERRCKTPLPPTLVIIIIISKELIPYKLNVPDPKFLNLSNTFFELHHTDKWLRQIRILQKLEYWH